MDVSLEHTVYMSNWRRGVVVNGVKTFLFYKSFPLQPFFFFMTDYRIPLTFTVTSEYIRFYFLVFLFYTF